MSSEKLTVLQLIDPPEYVYLQEALYWPAFGRFPVRWYGLGDETDLRFSIEFSEEYAAPTPEGEIVWDEECKFAGLPLDPRAKIALSDDGELPLPVERYDLLLSKGGRGAFPLTDTDVENFSKAREKAVAYFEEFDNWHVQYSDYVDQFQNSLCTALRKGDIIALGVKLPDKYLSSTAEEFEQYAQIEDNLDNRNETEIPKKHWISNNINWAASALKGRDYHFIRVNLAFRDVFLLFPPYELMVTGKAKQIGESYVVPTSTIGQIARRHSKRGRPPLPWDEFHVEVARMFRDDEMPQKKESAIAHFQSWFDQKLDCKVSRSAIGERLKPYYNQLIKKDRN